MYDTIRCEFPLPIAEPWATRLRATEFQTKSLDRTLADYVLRPDGQLWVRQRLDGDPDAFTHLSDAAWRWVRYDVIGDVDFYGGVRDEHDPCRLGGAFTFRATFDVHGLRALEPLEVRLP